jgi:integrase
MLLPLKAICDPKKTRRDGTSLIYLQYCFSSEHRTLLNTEIAIPPAYWNRKKSCIVKGLPEQYGTPSHLNAELTRIIRVAEDLIAYAERMQVPDLGVFVKSAFKPNLRIEEHANIPVQTEAPIRHGKNPDLFVELADYIQSKERKVTEKALATFKSLRDHLLAYQAFKNIKLTFDSFDYNFYENFVDFLAFDYQLPRKKQPVYGLKTNSIGKDIKQLRIFVRDRVKRKLIRPFDLSDYKIPDEETDAIYLSYDEIALIYQTDLTAQPHLIEYRDLFVLACLTGLRFSDFSTLKPEDLRMDMLHKKQGKSDHWVVIPMRAEAKKIFTMQFQERIPKLTNAEFNRHIKTIGKLAGLTALVTFGSKKGAKDVINTRPKYEWITTHTARRSFATNEFLAGTPVKLIMQITGHKNEKDFYRYIRISPQEAANKIQKLWEERDNMQAFKPSRSA